MKNKNVKTVWAVFSTRNEYGSFDEVDDFKGAYELKNEADKQAKGQGWYGGDGHVEQRTAVRYGNGWYITSHTLPIKLNIKHVDQTKTIREQALKKLTQKEKMLLGLED